jgi:hypothetical protein
VQADGAKPVPGLGRWSRPDQKRGRAGRVGCAQLVAWWIGEISARNRTGGCCTGGRANGNSGTIPSTAIAHVAIDVDIAVHIDIGTARATRTGTGRAGYGISRDTHAANDGSFSKSNDGSI